MMNLFSIKEVTEDDIDNLYQAIITSTNNNTKVTLDSLRKALITGGEKDSQYKTNRPCLSAFIVIEKESKLIVGQLLFVTHYTPWIGHMPHVVDLYVEKEHRRIGEYECKDFEYNLTKSKNLIKFIRHRNTSAQGTRQIL